MRDKDKNNSDQQPADRRTFLRKFLKKGAPLVVGAVAKPLSKLSVVSIPPEESQKPAVQPPTETVSVSDDLKKELENAHDEFIKNNPDFFEKP